MAVPINSSQERSGFGPQLSLGYDSGNGNGPFWLWLVACTTTRNLPQDDKGLGFQDSDSFILSGAEETRAIHRQHSRRDRA